MVVVTLILEPSGTLRLASDKITLADAERWAEEGKTVFRLVASKGRWALNHINSGKLVTDNATAPDADESPFLQPLLLTLKEDT